MAKEELDHEQLKAYHKDTVWRLQEEDIRSTIDDLYPDEFTSKQIDALVAKAHDKFFVESWHEHVIAFVDTWKDELEMGRCAVCDSHIDAMYSLCSLCSTNLDRYDERTDTYTMDDGSRYVFSTKANQYLKEE